MKMILNTCNSIVAFRKPIFKPFLPRIRSLSTRLSEQSSENDEYFKHIKNVVKVAIVGAPNSGKSTLINRIVDRKVCATSKKVHTTVIMARAMCVEGDTQIIFLDTPGVVSKQEQKKYKLPDTMTTACRTSLKQADVIGVVHDVSNAHNKEVLQPHILHMLTDVAIPSFLIVNKVDTQKMKTKLLDVIRLLTNGMIAGKPIPGLKVEIESKAKPRGYSHFSDVFLVSALNGDGVQDVKNYLLNNAKPSASPFTADDWTDQTPQQLATEAVRAKFMDFLGQELPYRITTELEYYEDTEEKLVCSFAVICPTERIVRLIAGSGGGRLQQIKDGVRQDLANMLRKQVSVGLTLINKEQEKK